MSTDIETWIIYQSTQPVQGLIPDDGFVNGCSNGVVHMLMRMEAIAYGFDQTVYRNQSSIMAAVDLVATCMAENAISRVFGVGRALIASLPGTNRFAHGGAFTSALGN